MTKNNFDIVVLGSSIVDLISYKPIDFLKENGLEKASMQLKEYDEIKNLYDKLGSATECSGGSAANSAAGAAMLGADCAFIGKTREDYLGKVFNREIEKAGVKHITQTTNQGLSTPKCIILVTEEEDKFGNKDIERTMATYLDPDVAICEDDIDEEIIKNAKIIFFEGYLYDNPNSKAAVEKAIKIAKENDTKVSFTLSDPFCVDRHRSDFVDVVENKADIIFANESEANSLYQSQDIRNILHKFTSLETISCITRSQNGSYIIKDGNVHDIEPVLHSEVYDVTGAGDIYAAGFLYGFVNEFPVEKSGHLASLCASEVIKYIGARPATDLKDLLATL